MNIDDIIHAANLIKSGKLVAFPTETVHGLGADAENDVACSEIYRLKGRPSNNPLIVHGSCLDQFQNIAEFNDSAIKLADFWPGPLTMVLKQKSGTKIANTVTSGLRTIAVRIPAHDIALDLINRSNCLIAAPSANKSGFLSPTTSAHVLHNFSNDDVFVLKEKNGIEKNRISYGLESTIIDLSGDVPTILRYGFITPEAIESVLGKKVAFASKDSAIKSPGMLYRHYSPRTKLRINATELSDNEIGLNFGTNILTGVFCLNLSQTHDLAEAARNLFDMLHRLDHYAENHKKKCIAVAPVPNFGIGLAINDKLARASEV
jgi:L-threonylcarbamoyladenylate synthase